MFVILDADGPASTAWPCSRRAAGVHARRFGVSFTSCRTPIRRTPRPRRPRSAAPWRRRGRQHRGRRRGSHRGSASTGRRRRRRRGGRRSTSRRRDPARSVRADLERTRQRPGDVGRAADPTGDERRGAPRNPNRLRPPRRPTTTSRHRAAVSGLPAAGADPRYRRIDRVRARHRRRSTGPRPARPGPGRDRRRPGLRIRPQAASVGSATSSASRPTNAMAGWPSSSCPRRRAAPRRGRRDGHLLGPRRPPLGPPTNCSPPTDAVYGLHLLGDYTKVVEGFTGAGAGTSPGSPPGTRRVLGARPDGAGGPDVTRSCTPCSSDFRPNVRRSG